MRGDERQASTAYAYAWWLSGHEGAARTATAAALAAPVRGRDDAARLVALMTGVRAALGDVRTMAPSSEVALLHDGFGVPTGAAAALASVPACDAALALAHGRLDALPETTRRDFHHPQRLAGLAVGDPDDVGHAADCRSCDRALALIERGRGQVAELASVPAPAGALAALPTAAAAPAGSASGGVPPGRVRAAAALAGAGVVMMSVLVAVLLMPGRSDQAPADTIEPERPALAAAGPTARAEPTQRPHPERTQDASRPAPGRRTGFAVVAAGLLPPGEDDDLAPSGATIAPDDPLRVAVDYANGSRGEEMNLVWRVDGALYERLRTVVSARASRHVWGLPVPAQGWPVGRHRIVITTRKGIAGAVDFTVRQSKST